MARKQKRAPHRADVLDGALIRYAPENELGVVFRFAHLAKRFGLRVDQIQPSFPDCIAYRKVGGRERKVRIEFELRSRNFRTHKHRSSDCDCIVCWEHNWPGAPKHIEIIELRREFGLGFNVWIQPIAGEHRYAISKVKGREYWNVPSLAHKGDLILFYRTTPDKFIQDIFRLTGPVEHVRAYWKPGKDYMGPISSRVCKIKAPIFFEDLKKHRILARSGFVRGFMIGRPRATEYWPYLYQLIVARNPSLQSKLKKYAPENGRF